MSPSAPQTWPTERAFLHELSTPLSTLGLELDLLIDALNASSPSSHELKSAVESVARSQKAYDRIIQMIQARRSQLP